MRVRRAGNGDVRNDAGRGSRRHAHERNAWRHGEILQKRGWLKRRMPQNTTPVRQATGGTHTTEPYSILFDTPNSPSAYDGRHPRHVCASRYGGSKTRCGSAETVSRSLRAHLMTKKIDSAALQPRALTAIFEASLVRKVAAGSDEETR